MIPYLIYHSFTSAPGIRQQLGKSVALTLVRLFNVLELLSIQPFLNHEGRPKEGALGPYSAPEGMNMFGGRTINSLVLGYLEGHSRIQARISSKDVWRRAA